MLAHEEATDLDPYSCLLVEAFGLLSRSRPQSGFGPCPISIEAMEAIWRAGYGERVMFLDFCHDIQDLDGVWMEACNEELDKQRNK